MTKRITNLEELAAALGPLGTGRDIFSDDPQRDYRRWVKLCHPDRFSPGPQQDQARGVFVLLTARFEEVVKSARGQIVHSLQRNYVLERLIARGDLADVHLAMAEDRFYVLKICRPNGGNALLTHEFRTLQTLARRSGDRSYRQYFPNPIETFVAASDFAGQQVNVFAYREGYQTLESIHDRFPDGLDARHLAWMFKRMLVAAGFAQQCGVVHGGFLPPHVLIHADRHGLQLVDWIQAVKIGRPLQVIATRFRDWYPPELLHKEPAASSTDIFMAAKCLLFASGGDPAAQRWPASVPAVMRNFMNTCLYPSPRMRPHDAWQLHEEFDELLLRLFGPPKYHRLMVS